MSGNHRGVLTPGTVVGPLRIIRLLGRGGMGEVYEAEQIALRRRVAVKRISEHLVEHPEALRRFEREAQTIARVHGEHVVGVHEFGRYPDPSGHPHLLLVLELVEGGLSLRRVLEAGPIPWAEATSVVRQAAEGLALAQEVGVVHRDVKPDNLLLTRRGVVKLTDFGLAKSLDSTGLSLAGTLLGTPAYLAPEVCAGAVADTRADLYGLGATWFHLLSGRTPFTAETTLGMLKRHQDAPVPDVRDLVATVPPAIAALVTRLLTKQPEARFASATALVEAIDTVNDGGLAVPRLVPRLAAVSPPGAPASDAPTTPMTPATAQAPTLLATPATAIQPPPGSAIVPTVIASAPPSPAPRFRYASRILMAVALAAAIGGVAWILRPQAPAVVATAEAPAGSSEAPAPPVSIVPAEDQATLLGQLDAALAAKRLGDAQRLAETAASRGWRADRVAAVNAEVRTAERGWTVIADEVEQAVDEQQWARAHARWKELPPDRINGTRAVAERTELLAKRIRQGASAAFVDAQLKVQDELDHGRPVMARHHLMIARPLADLSGKMVEWDKAFRRVSAAVDRSR